MSQDLKLQEENGDFVEEAMKRLDLVDSKKEGDEFNAQMEIISKYAEDVVKTWFCRINNKPIEDLFGDGLTNFVASIKIMPSPKLIAERRAEIRKKEESMTQETEIKISPEDGWTMHLGVVEHDFNGRLDYWKSVEPEILSHMKTLMVMAKGYIAYALERYNLPNPEMFANSIIPSPWGTLYVLGAENMPQIGVIVEQCKAGQ